MKHIGTVVLKRSIKSSFITITIIVFYFCIQPLDLQYPHILLLCIQQPVDTHTVSKQLLVKMQTARLHVSVSSSTLCLCLCKKPSLNSPQSLPQGVSVAFFKRAFVAWNHTGEDRDQVAVFLRQRISSDKGM